MTSEWKRYEWMGYPGVALHDQKRIFMNTSHQGEKTRSAKVFSVAGIFVVACLLVTPLHVLPQVPVVSLTNYPVRWTSEVRLESLDPVVVKKRLCEKVELGDNGSKHELEMRRTPEIPEETGVAGDDDEDDSRVIYTGQDYLEALLLGYETFTTYGYAMQSFFIHDTLPIFAFYAVAAPSKQSWVSDFTIRDLTASNLSYAVLFFKEGSEDGPYCEYDGSLTFGYDGPHYVTITSYENDEPSFSNILEHLGWGDFNGDGIEDLLFFKTEYSRIGHYRDYSIIALTRKNNSDIYRLLDITALMPGPTNPFWGRIAMAAEALRDAAENHEGEEVPSEKLNESPVSGAAKPVQ